MTTATTATTIRVIHVDDQGITVLVNSGDTRTAAWWELREAAAHSAAYAAILADARRMLGARPWLPAQYDGDQDSGFYWVEQARYLDPDQEAEARRLGQGHRIMSGGAIKEVNLGPIAGIPADAIPLSERKVAP